MLKGPPEKQKKEKSFFSALSFFDPLNKIEHKWKQFIVYASSNHSSHPRSHTTAERKTIYEQETRYQEVHLGHHLPEMSSETKKKSRERNKITWICFLYELLCPPKAIANEFLISSDTFHENWTWFHYVIALFVKVKKMNQNHNLCSCCWKTNHEREIRSDMIRGSNWTLKTRATCTWLFGSQMTALWLSFKMANECTQSTTQKYVEQAWKRW